jgi:DNA-binding HxlR family transcriptional regulator
LSDPTDIALLEAVARGEFAISGFRNRDIRQQLHPTAAIDSPLEQRRLAARVTRQLRILRAHGLIQKVPKTSRYRLTTHGYALTAAIFATRNADINQLLSKAA